jgi:hypothetical protein
MGFHGRRDDYDIAFTIIITLKEGKLKCIKCINKGDDLYNVFTYCTKFLKYDPFDIELKVFATSK